MFSRSELSGWVADLIAEHTEDLLTSAGFRRRPRAKVARRKADYGYQKIDFYVFSRPSYAPRHAHLTGHATLHMPTILNLADEIFGGQTPPRTHDIGASAPFDLLRPHPGSLWLFDDRPTLEALAPHIRQALATSVLPFLEATDTTEALVTGPGKHRASVETIAAALVHLGRPDDAADYLRSRVGHETGVERTVLSPAQRAARQANFLESLDRLDSHRRVTAGAAHSGPRRPRRPHALGDRSLC